MNTLELQNITKIFANPNQKGLNLPILSNITYTFKPGINMILGPSGSGKTSLINVLTGKYIPDAGNVLYEDKSIYNRKLKVKEGYLRKISYIDQFSEYNLSFGLNVYENLEYQLLLRTKFRQFERNKIINEYLILFGLDEISQDLIKNLSGGEKQRLAIIKAIITNPLIIFCDEPTASLDKENKGKIIDEFSKFSTQNANKIIVVVTHDFNWLNINNGNSQIAQLIEGEIHEYHS